MTAFFHQSCSLAWVAALGCGVDWAGTVCPPADSAAAPRNRAMAPHTMLLVQCIAVSSSCSAAHESGNGVTQAKLSHRRRAWRRILGRVSHPCSHFERSVAESKKLRLALPGAPSLARLCSWGKGGRPRTLPFPGRLHPLKIDAELRLLARSLDVDGNLGPRSVLLEEAVGRLQHHSLPPAHHLRHP